MKLKLLPHKVQKPAGIIILVSLVLMSTMIFLSLVAATEEGNPSLSVAAWLDSNALVISRLFVIVFTLSLAALLFSEEKVEDEMISHLRLRAVAISAIIVIGFKLIGEIIWVLLPMDFMDSFRDICNDLRKDDVSIMIILYLLIFKRSIHKYTDASDEEQS